MTTKQDITLKNTVNIYVYTHVDESKDIRLAINHIGIDSGEYEEMIHDAHTIAKALSILEIDYEIKEVVVS